MSREIKHRGWFQCITGKEYWVYGCLVKQTNGNWEITNDQTSWTVDNVGQFTGIVDVVGKEIYEGDVVNDDDLGNGIVIFQSGCFFMMYDADTNMEFLGLKTDKFGRLQEKRIVEILGNIYENPELLSTI